MFGLKLIFICGALFYLSASASPKGNLLPDRDVCGRQVEPRIYGGVQAQIGEFPWIALIEHREYGFICGGSLINSRYVVTAAHCIMDNIFSVRLGEHDLSKEQDCDDGEPGLRYCADKPIDVKIEEAVVHEAYDQVDTIADIALIRLKHEVSYSDFVRPVCLPAHSELRNMNYTGANAIVSGWGKTEMATASKIKLKVDAPVVSNSACSKAYNMYDIPIRKSQICAGGVKGKSACNGDSGGPLMYKYKVDDKENYVCIGLVSFGLRQCALDGIPVVYTRVSDYVPWVMDHMKP